MCLKTIRASTHDYTLCKHACHDGALGQWPPYLAVRTFLRIIIDKGKTTYSLMNCMGLFQPLMKTTSKLLLVVMPFQSNFVSIHSYMQIEKKQLEQSVKGVSSYSSYCTQFTYPHHPPLHLDCLLPRLSFAKGQLISKTIYSVLDSPKKRTKTI